ncbi:MAG: hypothetical protein RJQ14_25710 [Marinoscillum sp.]
MKHILILLLILSSLEACDMLNQCNVVCDPGAPELRLEIFPGTGLDSSYLAISQWKIHDGEEEIRLQINQDSTFEYFGLFMHADTTDSSIRLYGSGVIWNHLDTDRATAIIDYGNGDQGTLSIVLKENIGECCSSHAIEGVYYNGEELTLNTNTFYFDLLLEK